MESKEESKSYTCSICKKVFENAEEYLKHLYDERAKYDEKTKKYMRLTRIMVVADFVGCLIATVMSVYQGITSSNVLFPNIVWWGISAVYLFLGTRALGILLQIGINQVGE